MLSFTHIIPLLCFSHLSSTILSIKELTNIDIVFSSNHPQMGNSIINNKILRTILLIHIITTIKHNKYNKIYAIRLPTKYHMPLSLIIYLQSDLPQVKLQIFCCFQSLRKTEILTLLWKTIQTNINNHRNNINQNNDSKNNCNNL